jgi:hypothetical protein
MKTPAYNFSNSALHARLDKMLTKRDKLMPTPCHKRIYALKCPLLAPLLAF